MIFRFRTMDANRNGWHGMTIKDVIGKVDLANVATICDDGKWKKEKPQSSVITLGSFARLKNEATTLQSPSSAYLGKKFILIIKIFKPKA